MSENFKAQKTDTPEMLKEYGMLCTDALNYYKDKKRMVKEAKTSGFGGGLLDRELEALDTKIAWYIVRIQNVMEFMDEYIFCEDLFIKDKYPWVKDSSNN